VRLLAKIAAVGFAIATPFVTAGCVEGGDTSLYVHNGSAQPWYLSVPRKSGDFAYVWVVKVQPGADAFALAWDGGDTVPVSVLALDCSLVAMFQPTSGGGLVVDAIPGLTGRIEHHGAPLGSRTTTPGVDDTEDCGGFLFR
jgi:hypothetical protein